MKKLLVFGLSLAMLLSLTACHKPQAEQQDTSQPDPATTSTPADVSTPAPVEDTPETEPPATPTPEPVKDTTPEVEAPEAPAPEPPADPAPAVEPKPEPKPEQPPVTPVKKDTPKPAEETPAPEPPAEQTPPAPAETEEQQQTKPSSKGDNQGIQQDQDPSVKMPGGTPITGSTTPGTGTSSKPSGYIPPEQRGDTDDPEFKAASEKALTGGYIPGLEMVPWD